MNPVYLWRRLCIPFDNHWNKEQHRQADTLCLFTFLAFFSWLLQSNKVG